MGITLRRVTIAVLAAGAAGCVDARERLTAPEGPRMHYVTSVNVYCPGSLDVGSYGYCWESAWDNHGNPYYGTFPTQWWSSNPSVVSVSWGGNIYAHAPGSAVIYAEVDGVTGSAVVYVPAPLPPLSIGISGPTSITAEGTYTWRAQEFNRLSGESFTYRWETSPDGSSWSTVSTSGYYSRTLTSGAASFHLRLTTTSSLNRSPRSSSVQQLVSVSNPLGPGLSASVDGPGEARPNQWCGFFANVSGGTPPYSYSWWVSGGDYYSPSGEPYAIHARGSGSYFDVYLTVYDSNGAQVSAPTHRVSIVSSGFDECYL